MAAARTRLVIGERDCVVAPLHAYDLTPICCMRAQRGEICWDAASCSQSSPRKIVRPSTIVRTTRPCTGRPSNGAFFDFERKSSVLMRQAGSGSNRTRSAGAPGASRPTSGRRMRAGLTVSRRSSVEQAEMPVVVQLQRQRQQRFQPDDAVGRRAERQALQILVPRRSGRWRSRRSCRRRGRRRPRGGRLRCAAAATVWRRCGSRRSRSRSARNRAGRCRR